LSSEGDSEEIPGSTRILTFLLTDLKDSTELFNRYPDEMFSVMERHDDLLSTVIRRRGGEIFKYTGDGVFAVFDVPASAVVAAVEIQRAMLEIDHEFAEGLELRIGVNTGPSRQRGADYFGPALNTAARLEGAANGRQILVSQSTRQHLGDDDVDFTDLGIHRFKGLKPIQVFQACAPGLPHEFPPIGGKRDAPDGNLPASLSSFLGRSNELVELGRRLHQSRVVTLMGPGGIGKTRLAIEAARAVQSDFEGGVWLVELSPIDLGGEVWPSFATALGIAPLPGASPRVQVLDRLREAEALLVIDNCEHVLRDAASAVVDIASTARGVRMLTTSRRVLGVGGESIFDVSPLDEATKPGVASPAVSLFVERAQLASSSFQPTSDDLRVVADICADLDYLPLAIEIAAAQLRRIDLSQIHAKSSDPLALGSKKYHRAIGRQQTIRQTLEWSYELLDDTSAQVLDTLSVLSGSFVEDVGRDLCHMVGIEEDGYVEALAELLDSSLLARDPSDPLRFKILHLVRAFGRGRLVQEGRYEELEHLHGLTFARRIAQLGAMFMSPEEGKAATAIFAELPDMRAAFERAINHDLVLASDLTAPMFFFTYVHRGAEYGTWPARVMDQPDAGELANAPIILAAAACHSLHADAQPQQAELFVERARVAEARGGESSRGWIDGAAGMVALWTGDLAGSIDIHRLATRLAREQGNSCCEVISWSLAAYAANMMRDPELAGALLAEASKASESTGSVSAIGYVSFTRGAIEARRNPELAIEVLEASAEWAADAGNSQGFNRVRRHIADIRAAQVPPAQRLRIRAEGFLGLPETGDTLHCWSAAESLLKPLAASERHTDVALLAGALATSPIKIEPSVQRVVDDTRELLGPEKFESIAAQGSQLSLSQLRRHVEANYLGGGG
jgi:predicted ATPase/class 3 adenylate cyclase